jgi:Tfp pilus assembly protein PilX
MGIEPGSLDVGKKRESGFLFKRKAKMNQWTLLKGSCARNERGAALVTGLLLILVLTILSMAAMMTTAMELKMASNDRSAKQVFYGAEAGLEDARSRLQTSASASPINDNSPSDPAWTAFVGTETRATEKGYQSSNSNHVLFSPLTSSVDYVVTITHKLDLSSNILRWGDSNGDGIPEENTSAGEPIYVISSEGRTPTGAEKTVKIEAVKVPGITVPAALYTKAPTTLQGTSAYVLGMDHCGTHHVPGVITKATVTQNGNPTVTGSPIPIVENSLQDIDIEYMVSKFKKRATSSYDVDSATLTGMSWGSPTPGATQQDASSCSQHNVVYFNTNSTYVKLSGGTSGCGLLLVEGDLSVNGGFQWYGVVVVTGAITFLGGGGKNVTGGMLAGGAVSADLVGGDANIVYCSQAIRNQTEYLPLIILRWAELFS